ncbi:Nitric oxide reductase FlRd-NAD(+) reductase [Pragia fontium]|uniref:NADH:flavorubredoxin reductase NorW n=1 Tax=Pragia fontium TaxID=82985 RepID=UPI000E00F0D8|nr:NADH:flavorubredoxin reductase NorW [Pragia fontium]SUB82777.1 Nitric oxide reductase FlRd-NAD(+) reductase [Pragia fontium]
MENNLIIIGSGFAARQLVKNIRRLNKQVAITLIAADNCDEYNKPDLSHVFSLKQCADDLTRQSAEQFAQENNITLYANTRVTMIDRHIKQIVCGNQHISYQKLVLATGAQAIVPSVSGDDSIITFNSQDEYRQHQDRLQTAEKVMVLGAGLIGSELAMDLQRAGKQVILVDRAHSLLSLVMPAELSSRLTHKFSQIGIQLALNNELTSIEKTTNGIKATLRNGLVTNVDAVIAAIGLKPNISLATAAGLATDCGIQVNSQLQTSDTDIYALGDCAEVEGKVQPFLQPIQLAAITLAKNLLGATEKLRLPTMLTKVKTPDLPLFLAGETHRQDLNWEIALSHSGMVARGFDRLQQLRAFITSESHTSQAFILLRELTF